MKQKLKKKLDEIRKVMDDNSASAIFWLVMLAIGWFIMYSVTTVFMIIWKLLGFYDQKGGK